MNWIKHLNLKEIEYLSSKFSITYSKDDFSIGKSFSTEDVYDAIQFVKKEIWNQDNVRKAISVIQNEKDGEMLYYWPPEELEPIDGFLGKTGILNYRVAISDPISWICSTNPLSEHSPERDPNGYVRFLLENALFLVSLSKWIETGQLILLPDIHLWDYQSWLTLGEFNEQLFRDFDLENSPKGKELFRISPFESGVQHVVEMMRLMQNNSTSETIKKSIPGLTDKNATEVLQYMRSLSKEERDIQAVNCIASVYDIDADTISRRIEKLKKQSIFHLERYSDISQLTGSLSIHHSMPLTLALHIGNTLDVIPITDQKLCRMTFDLYTEVIGLTQEYKDKKELVESKVELRVPFLDGLSPEFVSRQRASGMALKLKHFLDDKWAKVRSEGDAVGYLAAIEEFSKLVGFDYDELKAEIGQLKRGFAADVAKHAVCAGGVFAEEVIRNDFWMAAAKSIPVLLGGGLRSYKDYDLKKFQLKKNPLFIFLE